MAAVAGLHVNETRLAGICDRYGIAELSVFGSTARGTTQSDSDVDVLYVLQPGRRPGWEIEQLSDELSDLLGRPVDLVARDALHARLRAAVLGEAQPLFAA